MKFEIQFQDDDIAYFCDQVKRNKGLIWLDKKTDPERYNRLFNVLVFQGGFYGEPIYELTPLGKEIYKKATGETIETLY